MRVHRQFAQGQISQRERPINKKKSIKMGETKQMLLQCRSLICQLQRENDQMRGIVSQKDSIIDKLMRQKQEHILHMSSCNSQKLSKELQNEKEKQEQLKRHYEQVTDKYENIIKKSQIQMDKLKSFNRALRVENGHLRQMQQSGSKRSRKVGSISSSCQKKKQEIPFELTQINSLNQQQAVQKSFQTIYHTPEPIKSMNSANLPSTEHSKYKYRLTQQKLWRSKELPKNLFKDHALSTFKIVKDEDTEDTIPESKRQQQLTHVISKLSRLLASSDDESN